MSPTSNRWAPLGNGLNELVRQDQVDHGGLVHHDEVGVRWIVLVILRIHARLELQQPVLADEA